MRAHDFEIMISTSKTSDYVHEAGLCDKHVKGDIDYALHVKTMGLC